MYINLYMCVCVGVCVCVCVCVCICLEYSIIMTTENISFI